MITLPSFEDHLAAIEIETERLGSVVAPYPDAPVPSCPEWEASDLLEHVGKVFSFWAHQLEAGDTEARHDPPVGGPPADESLVEWLDERASVLIGRLNELGPDEPCWNWSGVALDSGWVARRMALEIAIHRYDGELAAGEPMPIPPELAADGLDERLEVHLRTDIGEDPDASLGGPICLSSTDVEAAWVVEVGNGRLRVRQRAGPASVVVRGTASDLFLFSWNRIGYDALDLTGDEAVAKRWSTLPV